jgi:hypothetical protein
MRTVPFEVTGKLPINATAESFTCPLFIGGQFFLPL